MEIPESSWDDEEHLPEFAYVVLTYKVLEVCGGDYEGGEIKVAQGAFSKRKLKAGDEIALLVKPTREFREVAEALKKAGMGSRSEADITDYIVVASSKFDSCSDLKPPVSPLRILPSPEPLTVR